MLSFNKGEIMKSFNEWRKLKENSFGHDLGKEAQTQVQTIKAVKII
jgi:hypothetical protein